MLKKQVDCLFIYPPGSEEQGSSFSYHLGSSCIISYLNKVGYQARQFINERSVNLKGCIIEILNYNAKIIGFSVYDSNFNVSGLIAKQIKKSSPGTLIAFGGPCPSVHYEFIMNRYPFIDACFINESEEIFLQFISKLSQENFDFDKSDFTGINGISYRNGDQIFCNPENRILRDNSLTKFYLDKYPSPYLSGVIPASEAHNTGLITARGCNQNCVYCNCAVLSNRKFCTHSVNRVIEELEFISEHSKDDWVITFQDDAFTLIPQRAREICNAILDHRIKVHLGCITRCDCIDESLIYLMKEAGFVSISFSLESATPMTLRRIGKVHIAEDNPSKDLQKEIKFIESLEKMTAHSKEAGFKQVSVSIMLGLPHETIDEANHTIDVIEKNKNIDIYAHNYLAIYKGTPLFTNYNKYGYVINYYNDNPIFQKITYPVDVIHKVPVLPKSNLHAIREYLDKSTLGMLSLTYCDKKADAGFANILLFSDHMTGNFVKWLKKILIINGTVIQIYSDHKSMKKFEDRNYEKFVKHLSPTINLRSYYLEEDENGLTLVSSDSVLLESHNKNKNIKIRDFESFKLSLNNENIAFARTICREENKKDSFSAYKYFYNLSKKKDPFSFLINMKPLPYFANICKWTRNFANCESRNTLLVNDIQEISLCWYGNKLGLVGQSYEETINRFESEKKNIMARRNCSQCKISSNCIKCPCPHPLQEAEYCEHKKSFDITDTAELVIGLDQLKQVLF